VIFAPFVLGYLLGGFAAGVFLFGRYIQSRARHQNTTPWSTLLGLGWLMFIGSFVVGIGVVPLLNEPHRQHSPTATAEVCGVSFGLSFAVWLAAYVFWRKSNRPHS
jgi:hypothetical protein